MNEEEIKTTDLWDLYEKSVTFMSLRNIYSDTDRNYRMYNGNQWEGLKVEGIEKIQYNFIKPIIKHKVTTVTSNLFAVNYSPENIEQPEFMELAQKACDLLNKKASKVWDKDFMDKKVKKWTRQAAINDEAVCYVTYDKDQDLPINEIINKNDIMYGNENEDEIQLQPYILIRQRMPISELRRMAAVEGLSKEKIDQIVSDNDTSTIAGDDGKQELEDKCWVVTKLFKDKGKIYFSKATKYVTIKENKDTGLTKYPVAHFNWEDNEGNARGIGEVRQLIPNQLETNKTAMRRAISTKMLAYPQRVVNINSIVNKSAINKIGSTIEFKDMGNTKASDVFMVTSPAAMSPDSEKLQNELISYSRELNNASDITTGSINPEQASGKAILAVQNAQNQPLNDQLTDLKTFIEDIARIWFEMWKTYASDGLKVMIEDIDPVTGQKKEESVYIPSYILDVLETSVKVDITPKGSYDRYAQELSLENLLKQGLITFDEYVDSLDSDSVMPKAKLQEIIKRRKAAQEEIQNIQTQAETMKQQAIQRNQNAADIQNIANSGGKMIEQYMSNQGNEATE